MLDVHPPHHPIVTWKEFLVHLGTITIGLLIALSLEGWVEWMHHRHLVHEAEASLRDEIAHNSNSLLGSISQLRQQESDLRHDVDVLKVVIRDHKMPKDQHMEIGFHMQEFDNVSWKTAQSTGALAYMPYAQAKEYAQIYATQDELNAAQHQAARDAILSLAPFVDAKDSDPDLSPEAAAAIKDKIETLQGQLILVDSLVSLLDKEYKDFLGKSRE
jgi:hypothetical protein